MIFFILFLFFVILSFYLFFKFFVKKENFNNEENKNLQKEKTDKIADLLNTSNIDVFYEEKPSEIFIDIFKYSEPWRNGLENDRKLNTINI